MPNVIINNTNLTNIANAIRTKNKSETTYKPSEMAAAVLAINTDPSGDADATSSDILLNKTAYVSGSKVDGAMTNNGAVSNTITTQNGTYTIPAGYHNGSGVIKATLPVYTGLG